MQAGWVGERRDSGWLACGVVLAREGVVAKRAWVDWSMNAQRRSREPDKLLLHGVEDRTRDRSQDRTFGRCFSQQGKSLSVLS